MGVTLSSDLYNILHWLYFSTLLITDKWSKFFLRIKWLERRPFETNYYFIDCAVEWLLGWLPSKSSRFSVCD